MLTSSGGEHELLQAPGAGDAALEDLFVVPAVSQQTYYTEVAEPCEQLYNSRPTTTQPPMATTSPPLGSLLDTMTHTKAKDYAVKPIPYDTSPKALSDSKTTASPKTAVMESQNNLFNHNTTLSYTSTMGSTAKVPLSPLTVASPLSKSYNKAAVLPTPLKTTHSNKASFAGIVTGDIDSLIEDAIAEDDWQLVFLLAIDAGPIKLGEVQRRALTARNVRQTSTTANKVATEIYLNLKVAKPESINQAVVIAKKIPPSTLQVAIEAVKGNIASALPVLQNFIQALSGNTTAATAVSSASAAFATAVPVTTTMVQPADDFPSHLVNGRLQHALNPTTAQTTTNTVDKPEVDHIRSACPVEEDERRKSSSDGGGGGSFVVGAASWLGDKIRRVVAPPEREIGVENLFYYDDDAGAWRERGREHEEVKEKETVVAAVLPPPPAAAAAAAAATTSGGADHELQMGATTSAGVHSRYVIEQYW
eukprot:Lankesteria_metandrocarpae@DN2571_c1_g1_i1.p1